MTGRRTVATETCMTGICQCSFGAAPTPLTVPVPTVLCPTLPAANIMDNIPFANITPFGVCSSLAFPATAAATTAALGVLTPMPCVPSTPAPWVPGSPTVLVRNMPALSNSSKLMCIWGGVISITFPGQVMVQVK